MSLYDFASRLYVGALEGKLGMRVSWRKGVLSMRAE
jgi:hypothetical protein